MDEGAGRVPDPLSSQTHLAGIWRIAVFLMATWAGREALVQP